MQKTLIISMDWSVKILYKDPFYTIRELYAIKMDENGHSVGSYHYSMEDEEKELYDAWKEFRIWAKDYSIYAVWNQTLDGPIKHADSVTNKKYKKKRYVDLYALVKRMIPETIEISDQIVDTLKLLDLSYDENKTANMVYMSKAMVRIYRKLRKTAERYIKGDLGGFLFDMKSFPKLNHHFFPKLDKAEEMKRVKTFIAEIENAGAKCKVEEGVIFAESDVAYWRIHPGNHIGYMACKLKHYYRGWRDIDVNWYSTVKTSDAPKQVSSAISNYEHRISVGVGNDEITRLVDVIGAQLEEKHIGESTQGKSE